MSSSSIFRRLALFVALFVFCSFGLATVRAQFQVDLKLSRRSYILYEPLIATVTITNNTGRDVVLEDDGSTQWFNLELARLDGSIVAPYNPDYKLHPLTIPAGQALQRKIDVTPLFPIREMGTHRLRANIYFADNQKYYYSTYQTFDLTDGRLLWRQTVGVPGSEEVRQVSLLTHQLTDKLLLYVRVRDEDGDNVYTTQSLGRLIVTGREPQEFIDRTNTLHVLHEAVPGTYLYSVVDLNGQRVDQKAYVRRGTSRPTLVKDPSGYVSVRGGQVQEKPSTVGVPADRQGGAKLSDRPPGLPGSSR